MEILNTSIFYKPDFSFTSLDGSVTYTVSGNLSTEFYLYMMETQNYISYIEAEERKAVDYYNNLPEAQKTPAEFKKVMDIKTSDMAAISKRLKEFALKLIQLDKSKSGLTMETVNEQFNNFETLLLLFGKVISMLQEKVNNPN